MSKHPSRILAVGAACAVGLGVAVVPAAAVAAPVPVDATTTAVVNLLHFNDFHGRLDKTNEAIQFAGTVEQLRAEYPRQTVLLSGGDSIGASEFTSSSQQDEPTIEFLNLMGVDASAVGNHEFDQGVDDLTQRVAGLADFPYLSANVTRNGAPIGPAYELIEVDGITVGVIGAVTELTPSLVDMSRNVGVEFGDPVAAVNRVAAALTDGDAANGEADVIVAEIHDGSAISLPIDATQEQHTAALSGEAASAGAFGDMVGGLHPSVDVVFNAHTHATYAWMAQTSGQEPQLRPVLQSSEYGKVVGQVVLHVDRVTGAATAVVAKNHARTTEAVDSLMGLACLSEIATMLERAHEQAAVVGDQPVGTISGPISVPANANGNRAEESTAAQMVANMYRDQLAAESRGGAQIGLVNPGGVRASLLYEATAPETESGVVRLAEANAVLPFVNNLWTITLTGADLDRLLEQQWQRSADGTPFTSGRTYLQLGLSDNLTYVSDPARAFDDRVSNIMIDGVPVAADDEIRVATASFLMGVTGVPGDNFWAFSAGTDARDSGLVDLDALLAYLGDNPGLAPDYTVRHMDVSGLPTEPVAAGAPLTVTIDQIDRIRSLGATASTTVEILDPAGVVVGTGAVAASTAHHAQPSTESTVTFVPTQSGIYTIRSSAGSRVPFTLAVIGGPAGDVGALTFDEAAPVEDAAQGADGASSVPAESEPAETLPVESGAPIRTGGPEAPAPTVEGDAPVETDAAIEPDAGSTAETERVRARAAAIVQATGLDCSVPRAQRSAASVAPLAPTPSETPGATTTPSQPATPGASAPAPRPGSGGQGALPRTGGEVAPWLWAGAVLLMLLGVALVVMGRMRWREQ